MHPGGFALLSGMFVAAFAHAAEPRYFSLNAEVTRTLIMRAEPAATGRRTGDIPAGANGLENKGCRGASDVPWDHLSKEIRDAMARERWCRVRYQGVEGWVSARFLREGSAPPPLQVAAAATAPRGIAPGVPRGDGTLTGIEWRLALVGGMEPRDSGAWIRFRDNGDVEGNTGCNNLRATFVAGTTAMRVGPVAMSRMACTGESSAALERLLLGALEAVEAHQVADGILRIFDAGGAPRAVFRPAR
jgi:heat shock protein HslJ